MKTTFLSLFLTLIAFTWASAQSPRITADGKNVSISYGQPSKKGRVLFGKAGSGSLEPYGKVWRIGANEATEITFKKDGMFGGKAVKAGTYTLFALPTEKDWTIILNSELKQWGAYKYEEIKAKDVLKVTVPNKTYPQSEEKLTFTVKDTSLDFQWDKVGFSVPLKF
ncbi:DUF2911 domain-containing protein [Dyadobacter pollutisoli]|jgi:hypothetical protein|uniref:DUF2911 domain-containing protein n=1 Tax=Dyadobacter pollutisoli TaxID=2910158 RepID=A0A9E8N4Z1_9BACT|nr:DUF2911 domain-containing protein [Dyadobacter pollutisoli]WAC09860.1 DUF2911 domain-containing protein [Dyadobacter pollutisoli]